SFDEKTTFFTREELIERFDLARVSHNPAAFDREKLEWMNGHYIREAADDRLGDLIEERLASGGTAVDRSLLDPAVPLVKERMKLLSEAPGLLRFLFEEVEPDEKAAKMLAGQTEYLSEVATRLEKVEPWSAAGIEGVLRELQEERELGARKAFQPVRAAVTGTLVSPPLFESIELLGRDRTLARLRSLRD
ncbi:MAG TPA: glutamate--tRNA ligase, partial [Actinomycetota bacterium]|nr:glutamate--tRNA ligase [Actinomycetota bacterium]